MLEISGVTITTVRTRPHPLATFRSHFYGVGKEEILALLDEGTISPHPARSCGSGSPLPSLGEGLGVRAKSMLHTSIQQRQNM
jgi:hypothetical protein